MVALLKKLRILDIHRYLPTMVNSTQATGCLAVAMSLSLVGGRFANAATSATQNFHSNQLSTYHRSHTERDLQKRIFGEHEEMLRVQNMPEEINVDPRSTYNQKFMALMNSPCRPELDGFFGATSGDAIRIQYGFELEIEPLSDIMKLLDVMEDKVVDAILMNAFPEECGLRRRLEVEETTTTRQLARNSNLQSTRTLAHKEGHPSGFHFTSFQEVGAYVKIEKEL